MATFSIESRRALLGCLCDGSQAWRPSLVVLENSAGKKRIMSTFYATKHDGTDIGGNYPAIIIRAQMEAPATETPAKIYLCGSRGTLYVNTADELQAIIDSDDDGSAFAATVLASWNIESPQEYEAGEPITVKITLQLPDEA